MNPKDVLLKNSKMTISVFFSIYELEMGMMPEITKAVAEMEWM
jgi:hypothetical protein